MNCVTTFHTSQASWHLTPISNGLDHLHLLSNLYISIHHSVSYSSVGVQPRFDFRLAALSLASDLRPSSCGPRLQTYHFLKPPSMSFRLLPIPHDMWFLIKFTIPNIIPNSSSTQCTHQLPVRLLKSSTTFNRD